MEFGEILGGGFKLMGLTFANAGIITIILIVAGTLVVGASTQSYFDAMIQAFTAASGLDPEKDAEAFQKAMMPMMGSMALNLGVQFLYLLMIVFTQVIATLAGWYAAHGQKIGLGDLFSLAFKRSFWMSAIQTLMIVIFLFVIYLAVAIVGSLVGVPIVFVALYGVFFVWFVTKLLTRIQLIAIEDRGPWQGMMASMTLAKGNWLRSFLVATVPTVVLLAITIIFSMLTMGGKGLFDLQGASMSAGDRADFGQLAVQMRAMRDSLSYPFFALSGVLTGIFVLYFTHLTTLLYIDLKGRRGDFDVLEEEVAAEA